MDVVTLKKAVKDAGKYTDQELDLHKLELVSDLGGVHGLEIETGEWTPTFLVAGSPNVGTHSRQDGAYIRIGEIVVAFFSVTLSTKNTGISGQLGIGYLPFKIAQGFVPVASISYSYAPLTPDHNGISLMGVNPNTVLYAYNLGDNKSGTTYNASLLTSSSSITGSVVYKTSWEG